MPARSKASLLPFSISMTLIAVKKFEAEFIGMPIGREPTSASGKKGKLIRSKEPEILGEVGEVDATQGSPTYGLRVCVVGKRYVLDQWQIGKFGAAFDVDKAKEVKGYVFDDGRLSDDEAKRIAKQKADAAEAIVGRKIKEEAKVAKELSKVEEETAQHHMENLAEKPRYNPDGTVKTKGQIEEERDAASPKTGKSTKKGKE